MKLTNKFIKENAGMTLKEAFLEVFETPFTGWAKDKGKEKLWLVYFENGKSMYGINVLGNWFERETDKFLYNPEEDRPATNEEILEALSKKAVKRGYKEGIKVVPLWNTPLDYWDAYDNQVRFNEKSNTFYFGCCIFQDGTWATIIKLKQMTIQEIEKEFNIKVV